MCVCMSENMGYRYTIIRFWGTLFSDTARHLNVCIGCIHIYTHIYMCWCIHYLEIHVWSIWVSFWNWGTPFHPFIWSSFSHEHIGHELEAIPHFQTRSCLGFTNQKHQSNMSAALQFISPSLHLIGVALADFADLGEGIGLVGKFRCSSTSQTKRYTSSDSPLHNNVSGV